MYEPKSFPPFQLTFTLPMAFRKFWKLFSIPWPFCAPAHIKKYCVSRLKSSNNDFWFSAPHEAPPTRRSRCGKAFSHDPLFLLLFGYDVAMFCGMHLLPTSSTANEIICSLLLWSSKTMNLYISLITEKQFNLTSSYYYLSPVFNSSIETQKISIVFSSIRAVYLCLNKSSITNWNIIIGRAGFTCSYNSCVEYIIICFAGSLKTNCCFMNE